MEGNVPYCNLYQKLTCADLQIAQFHTSKQWNEYCNCEPKCKRTEYVISIMSSQISKHAAGILHTTSEPPTNLAKIGRIQDWNYLNTANKSYTDTLYELNHYMKSLGGWTSFLNTTVVLSSVTTIMRLCSLQKTCLRNASQPCENVKVMLTDVHQIQGNLTEIVATSFFNALDEDYNESNDSIADDFYVRSSHDILRNNASHMKEFYSKVKTEITRILNLMEEIQNEIKDLRREFEKNKSDINECETSPYRLNLAALSNLCSKYEVIRQNLTLMYNKYENLFNTVQTNQKLMDSHDWGIFDPETFYQDNYVELIIYFESLSTTKISQFVTDSLNSLICDLGGNLGLWLGGSLLTLAEIIDLAIVIPTYGKQARVINLAR